MNIFGLLWPVSKRHAYSDCVSVAQTSQKPCMLGLSDEPASEHDGVVPSSSFCPQFVSIGTRKCGIDQVRTTPATRQQKQQQQQQ